MRECAIRLLLSLLSLALGLVAIEFALARLPMSGPCRGRAPLWRPDAITGWALESGAQAEVNVCGGRGELLAHHSVTTSSLGLRDRERPTERTPGRARVLVLGDSFTEAVQVDQAETFAARLEQTLHVEMIDAGVSGYSTDNELRTFRARGRRFHPDVVLLVLHVGNDILENGPRLYLVSPHGLPPKAWLAPVHPNRTLNTCATIHRAAGRAANYVPHFIWRHSRITRFLLTDGLSKILQRYCTRSIGPPLIPGVPELLGVYGEPTTLAWQEGWEVTERLLTRLNRAAQRNGARLGVVLAPAGFEYDPRLRWYNVLQPSTLKHTWDYDYPYRRLGAFFSRMDIPWMSLLPALQAHLQSTGDSGCYEWDGHWTASGHAVVAEALQPFVRTLVSRDESAPRERLPAPTTATSPGR